MPTKRQLFRLYETSFEFPVTRGSMDKDGGHFDIPDPKPKSRKYTEGRKIGYYVYNPVTKDLIIIPLHPYEPPRKMPLLFDRSNNDGIITYDPKRHMLVIVPKT